MKSYDPEETFAYKLIYDRVVATPRDIIPLLMTWWTRYDFDNRVTRTCGLIKVETYVQSIDCCIRANTDVSMIFNHDTKEYVIESLQWKPT